MTLFHWKLGSAAVLAAGALAIAAGIPAGGPPAPAPAGPSPAQVGPTGPEPDLGARPIEGDARPDEPDGSGVARLVAPRPWETAVRMKVYGDGSIGFGSGTVIRSTPEEAFILTAAHYFRGVNGKQRPPGPFRDVVEVELFDGRLVDEGGSARVRPTGEHFRAEVVACDFGTDLALLKIRPGRRLPASPLKPDGWLPHRGMELIAVGCSEGRDATAWVTTVVDTKVRGLAGRPDYEAIACTHAPLQGRSGGGLFAPDGSLWGVCNYSEPRRDRGLYAPSPSIHRLLDRNGLGDPAGAFRAADFMREIRGVPPEAPVKAARSTASQPTATPAGPPAGGGTDAEDERLRAVEQKLDRVIEVLERLAGAGVDAEPRP